jgi:hypothetical protein
MAAECTSALREGDRVFFAIESVYLPVVDDLIAALSTADELVGTIVQFSESGDRPKAYAVVSLPSRSNVVVPVEKLSRIEANLSKDV